MAQQKPGVMLYFELRPSLRRLSSRERLALYDAIMDYGEWGVVPDFTGKLAVAWDFVQPKLDRDDEAYLRNVQQRRYALYARECKRDGAEPLSYKEWRVSKDSEAERPTSGDNGSYPSTNSNPDPNPNSNPNPDPTSCCYDNAAGKPPRQPQRLIPPTVEEVRAYAAQRGDPPAPRFPPHWVGAARSRPLRRSRSTFNEPPSCVSFGRLRASPTGRMHSSGYLRKTGVAGGCYPPLQRGCFLFYFMF